MPKRKLAPDPKAQSEKFVEEAQKLIDAGELDPIAAEADLDRVIRKGSTPPR